MKPLQMTWVLLFGVMLCAPCACEGFIAYTWVNQGMYTAGEPISYNLDFNHDSIMDLLFESNGMWFDVAVQNGNNRVIASGGDVYALPSGYSIGPDVDPDLWQMDPLGITLNSSATVPPGEVISTGQFLETTAFMGVQFYIDDLVHYGWVRISNPFPVTGGIIMDFAYETEAGIGIMAGAGAVPEPPTIVILGMGSLLLLTRQRKNVTMAHKRAHKLEQSTRWADKKANIHSTMCCRIDK